MDLRSTQLKDTYGNLLTIGTTAGAPTSGTLENGQGADLTDITIQGTSDATLKIDSNRSNIILSEGDTTDENTLIRQQSSLFRIDTVADDYTTVTRRFTLDHSSGDISFRDTSTNEAFYWDASAGSLGIGTTSPAYSLDVNGKTATVSEDVLRLSARPNSGGEYVGLVFDNESSGVSAIRSVNGAPIDRSNLAFYTSLNGSTTERMRIDSSGNVGIGTTSPAVELDVDGEIRASDGILFGTDTASANALDDYEEGTWTATLEGATTAGTYTFSTNQSIYTKIGRQVTVISRLVVDTASGGVGSARFGGLPFNKANTTSFTGSAHLKNVDVDNSTIDILVTNWATSASAEFLFISTTDNSSAVVLDIAGISSGDTIEFSFTYFV